MIFYIGSGRQRKRPEGKVVVMISPEGKKKKITLRKSVPSGCSRARRICIKCMVASIHKNSKLYESKICEACSQ